VAIEVGKLLAGGFTSATNAISGFVSNLRTTVDETAKLARRTGIAVEALQGFQVAAGLSGVKNLEGALQRLTIAIGDAGQGNKTAQEAFDRLGLSFEKLSAMAPEDQFRAVSAAISQLPTQAERAAAAADLFGRTGIELLPMFESNLAAIEERAKRLGIILSGDQTSAIENMNDALSLVQQTFEGIIGQVTANLAPMVTAIAEEFLSFVEAFKEFGGGGSGIANAITEGLLQFGLFLAGVFDTAIQQLDEFSVQMMSVAGIFDVVANVFVAVAETIRALWNVLEGIVDGMRVALGAAIEKLGYLIPGLAEIGRQIREDAGKAAGKNFSQAVEAGINAANAALGDRNFGKEAKEEIGGLESAMTKFIADWRATMQDGASDSQGDAAPQAAAEDAAKSAWDSMPTRTRKEVIGISEEYRQEIQKAQDDYARKTAEMEKARIEDLAAINQKALEQSDIRSGGISQVLAMATGREDPAVTEARKQLKELQALRRSVELMGGTVEIVGAA
jgi:low affinity Fe/Cu permease